MNQDLLVCWSNILNWADDMFVDRKEVLAPARQQRGLKESAIPDHHGFDEMIFVTDVEIAYELVCTLLSEKYGAMSVGYLCF
jgi:hypothetical protein